jgi:protein-S-isoprenylcysteine O-methyltransferase Ste14
MERLMDLAHIKRRLRRSLFLPVFFILLFAPAGTLDYWQAWLFGFVFIATTGAIALYFVKRDPKLVERRRKVGPAAEREPNQKIIMTLLLAGSILLIVVPGLDRRWGSSDVPVWLVIVADVLVFLGFLGTAIVMRQNSYAASTIQVETDQPVVSTGLYGIVRHPMYSAALLLLVFTPLALGSYWGLLVVAAIVPVLAWRFLDEERFLHRNLPGYTEYCGKVRYRLVPKIW